MKTILSLFILFPSFGFACTKDEAVETLQTELLDKVGYCRVLEVEDLQKDWWGHEFYRIKFSCVNDDYAFRLRRVYIDPETKACHYEP